MVGHTINCGSNNMFIMVEPTINCGITISLQEATINKQYVAEKLINSRVMLHCSWFFF
jgi:hypothetical protein